jgi:hypothetical protein
MKDSLEKAGCGSPNDATRQARLSKNQQNVLDKMKDGWQLGLHLGFHTRYWLQKNGCGNGGETMDVNAHTAHGLRNKGLIIVDTTEFPLQTFRLSHSHPSATGQTLTKI